MDIEKEKLKLKCNSCQKDFYMTFNTTHCPNCDAQFNPEDVHKIFYDYESRLANSKLYRFGEKMEKTGNTIESAGGFMQQLGCFIFMIPIGLFCLWVIFSML